MPHQYSKAREVAERAFDKTQVESPTPKLAPKIDEAVALRIANTLRLRDLRQASEAAVELSRQLAVSKTTQISKTTQN